MTAHPTDELTSRKPLRLWAGVVVALLILLVRYVLPIVLPDAMLYGVIGGGAGALAIAVWWLFFSRARWSERVGAIALIVGALSATYHFVHVSIANGGMGMLLSMLAIPILAMALVAWAVATQHLSGGARWLSMIATILLACGAFTLVRTGGVSGDGGSDLHWRWTATPEQRLLAGASQEPLESARGKPMVAASPPAGRQPGAEWPGFRGPQRDGIVRAVRIKTDWTGSPPVQMWRRAIGPGWSSLAVGGDLLYTQEQRGEEELVACYRVSSGEPVWTHRDAVRFWESNAGPGPRGTPTLSNGRLYSFGATGVLNALDAGNGTVVWSRDVATESKSKVPMWGFASSPLVIDDVVVVAAIGKVVAYDLATGNPRWSGPAHGGSYSSPHLTKIDGIAQILQLSGDGLTSLAPGDGALLWEHSWPGFTIVQPAVAGEGQILLTTSGATGGIGARRLAVAHKSGGWTTEALWTSPGLKPYFNDYVVHKNHAFGFDGSILSCISLEEGQRKWKGGRYGNGQLILLADQDVLLVLSETGELALVGAVPEAFRELARFPAIQGKTWNHPAIAGDVLLVRNGQEMAAFRLSLAAR